MDREGLTVKVGNIDAEVKWTMGVVSSFAGFEQHWSAAMLGLALPVV